VQRERRHVQEAWEEVERGRQGVLEEQERLRVSHEEQQAAAARAMKSVETPGLQGSRR